MKKSPHLSLIRSHIIVFFFIIVITQSKIADTVSRNTCNEHNCLNGKCVSPSIGDENSFCECFQGFTGAKCDRCYGRVSNITLKPGQTGVITDGPGNYTFNTKCSWLLQTTGPNIRFRIDKFQTECGWDHLYIFDGANQNKELIGALSGILLDPKGNKMSDFVTTTNTTFIHFFSDAAYNMSGFRIHYEVEACPSDCSNRGKCWLGKCICDSGFSGEDCSFEICPNNCSLGECRPDGCKCPHGYAGEACNQSSSDGTWRKFMIEGDDVVGRASHATATESDDIYIVGGETWQKEEYTEIFKFKKNTTLDYTYSSQKIKVSDTRPKSVYDHAVSYFADNLYMTGGSYNQETKDEVWKFDIKKSKWEALSNPSHPFLAVKGHTSHIFGEKLYIFLGFSPKFGYVNWVQEFCVYLLLPFLENFSCERLQVRGARILGRYRHSSVIYENNVYVYGGLIARDVKNSKLVDELYSFNLLNHTWTKLPSSGKLSYLHSAVVINDQMLIFGGNIHSDTVSSTGVKCHSSTFISYKLKCEKWTVLNPIKLQYDISRYGHTAFTTESKMFIFGGFGSRLKNDLIEFTPGTCKNFKTKAECFNANTGSNCVFADGICWHRDLAKDTKNLSEKISECKQPDVYMPIPILLIILMVNVSNGSAMLINVLVMYNCNHYQNCSSCQTQPHCGWCNNKANTGKGKCMEGNFGKNQQCQGDWFYSSCPDCQCNGHASCDDGSNCDECDDPMEGRRCEKCGKGFYGLPFNGQKCKKCECNNRAESCNEDGRCSCSTKGMIKKTCSECDRESHYDNGFGGVNITGNGTCFYELATDFAFTFTLDEPSDSHIKNWNFMNRPIRNDKDADISISCHNNNESGSPTPMVEAYISWNVGPGPYPRDTIIHQQECDYIRHKIDYKKYRIGPKYNTTLYIFVSNFKVPRIVIKRARIELRQMASRPFAKCLLDLTSNPVKVIQPAVVDTEQVKLTKKKRHTRRKKSPLISLEPMASHKSGIVTVFMRLPTGDSDYPPYMQSGLALASCLVTLGPNSCGSAAKRLKESESNNKKQKKPKAVSNDVSV
ncbi:DgyrCDS7518 [Dimorphilus gyrociliatus]|uniref:DgyrCDS7518 n=1 Tax=Dimorphilus gyrociliatus TaxID=2664684 RepID=A0A7I8VR97_9ANNE|nr:DgyrCDS7518 [Dimorphilus gyrociliatus]